jgi:hypothetical protein
MKERIGKYLHAEQQPVAPGKKTSVWAITGSDNSIIGWVRWNGAWRSYALELSENTVWSDGCLEDAAKFLKRLNAEHKAKGRS